MRILSMLLITAAALAAAAPAASAQTRDGFFVGFGAGWGSAGLDAEGADESDREGSVTANVRLGTAIGDRTLVGLELNGWFDSEDEVSTSLFNTSLALYFYPSDSGLFLKGGAGLSRTDFDGPGEDISGIGWGVMAGIGYDIAISDSAAVTPVATYWYGKPGDLEIEDIPVVRGFSHNVVEIGVSLTFY